MNPDVNRLLLESTKYTPWMLVLGAADDVPAQYGEQPLCARGHRACTADTHTHAGCNVQICGHHECHL